jgi:tetratricopeptide (TPR) repeat protein
VLEGSIAALGTAYVLGLRASLCRTGNVLAEDQVQAARKEDVLKALSQIAKTFRTRVGESLATVEKHSAALEEATTASLDALKAYSAGSKLNVSGNYAAALPLFKRATELDPQFAMAFMFLGRVYAGLGEATLSAESSTRAYELRHRASDRERFFISQEYDRQVTGNLERQVQTLTLWAQTYPRDYLVHGLLTGFATHGTGRYELCLEEAPKAIALDPNVIFPYLNLVACNLYLERIDQAERAWQRAATLNSTFRDVPLFGYYLAFLKGDRAGMDHQAAVARSRPGGEESISHIEALVLARAGRLEAAATMARRAVDVVARAGRREGIALYEMAPAVWNAFFGEATAARQHAAAALQRSRGRDAQYAAAVALALAGDMTQAQPLAADLEKRYPEDTSVQSNYLPTLRALFSLHAGQPSQAIEQLQAERSYEFADPAINFRSWFGALYPVYVRGEAYLAANKGAEAAAEFQKILDHRGLVLADPMAARARVELGRAWAMAGDRVKARAAYEDFLALWKDADPDIPILRQAKAEYGKLQ